jgi:hypothetical protein
MFLSFSARCLTSPYGAGEGIWRSLALDSQKAGTLLSRKLLGHGG